MIETLGGPVFCPLTPDRPSPVCPASPESLAGDIAQDDDHKQLFECVIDGASIQSNEYPTVGVDSAAVCGFDPAGCGPTEYYYQQLGNPSDPPFILTSPPLTPGYSIDDSPEWTADRPITIHGQEYSSLADHIQDIEGNMTFLNRYRSPESLKYDYTASPPYIPEYTFTDSDVDMITPLDDECDRDWRDWSFKGAKYSVTDSPPYVPMDYNTLQTDLIDPDDDKYYVMSPDYNYVSLGDDQDQEDIPALTRLPPSYELDYAQFSLPSPGHISP